MLWDLIRDYFVQYIFGGFDSLGEYHSCSFGHFINFVDGEIDDYLTVSTDTVFLDINGVNLADGTMGSNVTNAISVGDWLSTTATIITLVIILVCCGLLIKKMVSTVSHLLGN